MKFSQGHNRNQINNFPVSPDQSIDPENEVRIIDLFVESLSVKEYGFRTEQGINRAGADVGFIQAGLGPWFPGE